MSAKEKGRDFLRVLFVHRKTLILILAPLLILPVPFTWKNEEFPSGGNMAYCLILMATYWVTEVMPLAVTAMMPIFLFPLMKIAETDDTCRAYFNDVQFLVIGGLLIAIAVETWNVHERIALSVLQLVGAKIRWIMLGFMLVTAVLSMFISNTATTAMMTPIANAILDEIRKSKDQHKEIVRKESLAIGGTEMNVMNGKEAGKKNSVVPLGIKMLSDGNQNPVFVHDEETSGNEKSQSTEEDSNNTESSSSPTQIVNADTAVETQEAEEPKEPMMLDKMMLLSVCWSANLGGLGMLTGTTPNLVLKGHVDAELKGVLTFLNWSGFCIPTVFLFLIIAWIWLQIWFLGFKALCQCARSEKTDTEKRIERLLRVKYESLGKVKFAEIVIMVLFFVLVVLWFTRDFGFAPGYGSLFEDVVNITTKNATGGTVTKTETVKYLKDAVPAILVPMLLFVLPSTLPKKGERVPRLLDWKTAQNKMPWNVIMLLGGGFALALGMKKSQLSEWVGHQMKNALECVDVSVLGMLIALVVTMTTEVASNTATTQIFTPIMDTLARSTGNNPFNTLIPTAVSASFAFMLPVATPPNAIAFSYGKLTILDMALPGIVMNLMGVLVIGLGMNTWGVPIFHLHNPNWPIPANPTSNNC